MNNPSMAVEVKLEPCPFCGDRMQLLHDTLRHLNQGGCPIGAYAWGGEKSIESWNRRALVSPPLTAGTEVTEEMVQKVCRALDPAFPVGWNPIRAVHVQKAVHDALSEARKP